MEQRIGVVAVLVESRETSAEQVNRILSRYGDLIVGRMGIPYKDRGVSVISLIVDGTTDEVGAMTGQLGKLDGVSVRSVFSKA